MLIGVDYVSAGRDYDGLSLTGYRRSSCYAAAAATGSLSSHHPDNAGGRNSVGKLQRRNVFLCVLRKECLPSTRLLTAIHGHSSPEQ